MREIYFIFQNFVCPPFCICKSHAVYCAHTGVDVFSFPLNTTLLYLLNTTSISMELYDLHSTDFLNLLVLNMSASQIPFQIIQQFLDFLPNLRVLYMRNSLITNLDGIHFKNLWKLQILDLQLNSIHSLSSRCMLGLSYVLDLDFHQMSTRYIQSRAFEGLYLLELLNMSNNSVGVLNRDIFHDLPSLLHVDITHNVIIDIHISTFHGLDIIVSVSSNIICCYMKNPANCETETLR